MWLGSCRREPMWGPYDPDLHEDQAAVGAAQVPSNVVSHVGRREAEQVAVLVPDVEDDGDKKGDTRTDEQATSAYGTQGHPNLGWPSDAPRPDDVNDRRKAVTSVDTNSGACSRVAPPHQDKKTHTMEHAYKERGSNLRHCWAPCRTLSSECEQADVRRHWLIKAQTPVISVPPGWKKKITSGSMASMDEGGLRARRPGACRRRHSISCLGLQAATNIGWFVNTSSRFPGLSHHWLR